MNVGQIRTRVQSKLGDTSGAEVTSADVLNWINDGITEIARRTQQPQGSAVRAVVTGQAAYDLGTFAGDVIRLRSVMYDGSVLQGLSMEEADAFLADRERSGQSNGTPTHYWVWAEQINLWPPPDNSTKQLKLFYQRRPALLTLDADVPAIPLHMHGDLVDYVVAQALDTAGERDSADRRMSRFDGLVREAAADADWPQRATYPHITVSPDDAGYY